MRAIHSVIVVASILGCSSTEMALPGRNAPRSESHPRPMPASSGGLGTTPPPTRRDDVVDVRHGLRVVDPYRWLETTSPEQEKWLASQNTYARSVLSSLPARDRLRGLLKKANRGIERVDILRIVGQQPRVFALRRAAHDESAKLVVRDGWDGSDRVLIDPMQRADGTSHVSIDVASPSPDGAYVAYVVSTAGSEDGTIEVVEVESGRVLPDRIDRTQMPVISWRPDARSFFYWRRAKPAPGATPADHLKDSATYLHVLGTNPSASAPVIGAGMGNLGLGSHDYTAVDVIPGSRWVLARVVPAAAKFSYFVAPADRVKPGRTPWRRIAGIDDGVESVVIHGGRAFAFTSGDAPNYRIVAFDVRSGSIARATTFVAESDLVLQDFVGAADAMYVVALDRGVNRLLRIPWNGTGRTEVMLPFAGSIGKLVADSTRTGVVFSLEGWTEPPRWFRFDSTSKSIADLRLTGALDAASDLVAERATAVSRDGTEVPLSVVRRRSAPRNGTSPAILHAYGAYGTLINPSYNPFTVAWVTAGGTYAACHARGGSERGSSWHRGGMRQKKENGVDDVIACAEYLTKAGYSRSRRLTAFATSAGGILIGGAITKRPELFNAAVVRVGTLNLLRVEVTAGGPLHFEEYGNPNVEADFRSLLASDPYHRIRDGLAYPAVLLTAGRHDPRVPAWMPGKFAARLQAANKTRPTLLRVEADAGHGIGSTQTQREEEYADIYAFALWQAGIVPR